MDETRRDLQVGDDERDHVVGLLQKAVGRGLLDVDQFTERTDAALTATTRGQLNSLLVDLPGAEATPDRLELTATHTNASIDRHGRWAVPREIVVHNRWYPASLDFTTARFLDQEVRITVDATAGAVELWLPVGAGVTVAGLEVTWGGGVTDTRPEPFTHGSPHLTIVGRLRAAQLTINGPRQAPSSSSMAR